MSIRSNSQWAITESIMLIGKVFAGPDTLNVYSCNHFIQRAGERVPDDVDSKTRVEIMFAAAIESIMSIDSFRKYIYNKARFWAGNELVNRRFQIRDRVNGGIGYFFEINPRSKELLLITVIYDEEKNVALKGGHICIDISPVTTDWMSCEVCHVTLIDKTFGGLGVEEDRAVICANDIRWED